MQKEPKFQSFWSFSTTYDVPSDSSSKSCALLLPDKLVAMVSVSVCIIGTYSIKPSLSLIEQITSYCWSLLNSFLSLWNHRCSSHLTCTVGRRGLGSVVCKDEEKAAENNVSEGWTKAGITTRKKLNEKAFCPFRSWTVSGIEENVFFCDPASFRAEDTYIPFKIHRADLEKNLLFFSLENSVKHWQFCLFTHL